LKHIKIPFEEPFREGPEKRACCRPSWIHNGKSGRDWTWRGWKTYASRRPYTSRDSVCFSVLKKAIIGGTYAEAKEDEKTKGGEEK